MLQFGFFSSHIPYLVAVIIYVTYFGMSSFYKNPDNEKQHTEVKKQIVKAEQKKADNLKTFYYTNYFIQKEPNKRNANSYSSIIYICWKIPDYLTEKGNTLFSRPPPAIV